MSKVIDVHDSPRVGNTLTQVSRQSVLANAYQLGGLVAKASGSDADLRELCVHVGRLVAAGSDTRGQVERLSLPHRSSEGALGEVYALMLETLHARDSLTLEQQLEAFSVHLGAIIASGYPTEEERRAVLDHVELRLHRACLAASRMLEKELM